MKEALGCAPNASNNPDAEEAALPAWTTPEAVMGDFVRTLAGAQASGHVRLFCHAAVPERLLCILELPARLRARSDGRGEYEARSTLSRAYRISPSFTCSGRADGRLTGQACDDCRARIEAGAVRTVPESWPGGRGTRHMTMLFSFHAPETTAPQNAVQDNRRLVET